MGSPDLHGSPAAHGATGNHSIAGLISVWGISSARQAPPVTKLIVDPPLERRSAPTRSQILQEAKGDKFRRILGDTRTANLSRAEEELWVLGFHDSNCLQRVLAVSGFWPDPLPSPELYSVCSPTSRVPLLFTSRHSLASRAAWPRLWIDRRGPEGSTGIQSPSPMCWIFT